MGNIYTTKGELNLQNLILLEDTFPRNLLFVVNTKQKRIQNNNLNFFSLIKFIWPLLHDSCILESYMTNNELIEENVVSLLLIVYLGHNVHHVPITKEIGYNWYYPYNSFYTPLNSSLVVSRLWNNLRW